MYEIRKTKKFDRWLKKLKNNVAKIAILKRLDRVKDGDFGDSRIVRENVFELRFDIGEGYRVYFTNMSENLKKIIFLLAGGTKSTQDEDIKTAIKMAKEILL